MRVGVLVRRFGWYGEKAAASHPNARGHRSMPFEQRSFLHRIKYVPKLLSGAPGCLGRR
jgi:hypothetical protein